MRACSLDHTSGDRRRVDRLEVELEPTGIEVARNQQIADDLSRRLASVSMISSNRSWISVPAAMSAAAHRDWRRRRSQRAACATRVTRVATRSERNCSSERSSVRSRTRTRCPLDLHAREGQPAVATNYLDWSYLGLRTRCA